MADPEGSRLAAILFTDVVGYTALTGRGELAGRRVRERQRNDVGALAAQYGGQLVDETGDELVLWGQQIARPHPPGAAP